MHSLPSCTFVGVPTVAPSKLTVPFAFLGVPFGPPCCAEDLTVAAGAADAVRTLTQRMDYPRLWTHDDFDLGSAMFPGAIPSVADCGDV